VEMAVGHEELSELESQTTAAQRKHSRAAYQLVGGVTAAWACVALVSVCVFLNGNSSASLGGAQQLAGLGAVVINKHGVVHGSAWMATAMAELENAHHNGLQMLEQVHAEASAMPDGPSKLVKLALADGLATKLAQLSTTSAGEQFLADVNKEAKGNPAWVKMVARQAARNMLLEVIHATKQEILLESGNVAPAKLSASAKSVLSDLAEERPSELIAAAAKSQVSEMLPAEMGKVATMLGTEPSALQSLATADETKIKLPVTLEVAHKLTEMLATPAGSDFIKKVKSQMTGKETPEELDEVAYKAANTMLKQLVQSVDDNRLVSK